MTTDPFATLSFKQLVNQYGQLQEKAVKRIQSLASSVSQASPGKFLLAQFYMAQVTQVGDTISNLIAQVNSVISNAIKNQRTG